MSVPDITVIGNLTADPELRFTQSGAAVTGFTIAINHRKYDKRSGEWVDDGATFLRCSVWRDMAEYVAESLTKGTQVIVVGQLKARTYTDRDGVERTSTEIAVSDIGPSLRFAPVTLRPGGKSSTTPPSDDPWGGDRSAKAPF